MRLMEQKEAARDSLLETAAEWVARIQAPEASEEDFAQWEEWLKSDPAHPTAYAAAEEVWELVPLVEAPWPTQKELAEQAATEAGAVLAAAKPRRSFRRSVSYLAAAAALALVAVGGWYLSINNATVLETTTAEQRSVALADGSRVTLAAETRLTIEQRPERRGFKLERGQAYFEVTRDPGRPFVVRIGDHEAVAVGTAFDINAVADQFTVTVTQGVVQVRSLKERTDGVAEVKSSAGLQLQVGDRAAIDRTGYRHVEHVTRPEDVAAWRSGRLEYVRQPLKLILQDVNRYTTRKIEFRDPAIGEFKFTGTVFVDHLDGWLTALRGTFPIEVVERGSHRLLQRGG